MKFLTDLVLKKSSSPINIKIPESVQVTEQDHLEALHNLEDNPAARMATRRRAVMAYHLLEVTKMMLAVPWMGIRVND